MIKQETIYLLDGSAIIIKRYMLWFTDKLCINIIKGDIEVLHDHPWDYFTLILWGGYDETIIENTEQVTKRRYPGYYSFKKYNEFHRLTPIKKRAITLFFRFAKKKNYTNFLVNGKAIRDIKYWMSIGVDKNELKDRLSNGNLK